MLEYFERMLRKYVNNLKADNELYDAFEYSIFSGGKRIRPQLCLYLAKSRGQYNLERFSDIAIAVELIHTYSLVHDDLPEMDNDTYRRGKLTTHAKYSHSIGLLTGDALLTEAFGVIANSNSIINKDRIISELVNFSGMKGMVYGQYLDIYQKNPDIYDVYYNKTVKMILCPVVLTLIELGIENIEDQKEFKIAKDFGFLFQLKDDINDVRKLNEKTNYAREYGIKDSMKIYEKGKKELLKNLDDTPFCEYIKRLINEQ